ncbi:MAG TPA: YceI family protein [Chitinophagaceae bacterium]|nr:YceI family protein [Chitinophagaceae bacterium]
MTKTLWKMDQTHSEIQFKAKHMIVSTVTGAFHQFEAQVETEGDDFEGAKINFSADTASISTGQEARDNHLKSDDFFNAEKYPKLIFESTNFKKISGQEYQLKGNLTVREVKKAVEFEVEFGGKIKDPYGNTRVGFSLTGKINRKDYNLKWNALLESGNAVVSDEIKIFANLEFTKVVN